MPASVPSWPGKRRPVYWGILRPVPLLETVAVSWQSPQFRELTEAPFSLCSVGFVKGPAWGTAQLTLPDSLYLWTHIHPTNARSHASSPRKPSRRAFPRNSAFPSRPLGNPGRAGTEPGLSLSPAIRWRALTCGFCFQRLLRWCLIHQFPQSLPSHRRKLRDERLCGG